MNIEVSNKTLDALGRSEWTLVATTIRKSRAFKIAMRESKKSLETEVLCKDDEGEVIGHYYFQNGKMTIDMSV